MSKRWRVVLAGELDAEYENELEQAARVMRVPGRDEAALIAAARKGCDAIIGRTYTPITAAVLEAGGERLKVVGVAGVGIDCVDLHAADARRVRVLHTPAASSDAVAELTLALLLSILRPLPAVAAAYRRGEYATARRDPLGPELCTLRVGIVGMGRIGSRVGRIIASGFGADVVYNDIAPVGPFEFAARPVEKAELFATCDVVTLHVPLAEATRGLINADTLAQFKHGSYLVNTARGAIVDTAALEAALAIGRLAGAGLDVVEPEPLPPEHPLFNQPRCLLTPHVAARTPAAVRRMHAVARDVLLALEHDA